MQLLLQLYPGPSRKPLSAMRKKWSIRMSSKIGCDEVVARASAEAIMTAAEAQGSRVMIYNMTHLLVRCRR